MWIFHRRSRPLLCLILQPDHLILSVIDRKGWLARGDDHHQLQAYERRKFENNEFYQSRIFNYQSIARYLMQFMCAHHIKNPALAIAIDGSCVTEHLMCCVVEHETDGIATVGCDTIKNGYHSSYLGRCQYAKNYAAHYQCSIDEPNVLQCHLLASLVKLPLVYLTSYVCTQLSAFSYRNGAVTVPVAPGDKNSLNAYVQGGIKTYDITHHVEVSRELTIDVVCEKENIIAAFGLFLLGNRTHEKFR